MSYHADRYAEWSGARDGMASTGLLIQRDLLFDDFDDGEPIKETRMAVVKRKLPTGVKKRKGGTKGKVRGGGPALELSLPTARSEPSDRLSDYLILLFGEKKIGKTDLTAQFPNTFHLMTEPGGKAQSIFQRAVNSWREFLGYVRLLEKDKRFANVTVDTADILYQHAFDHVAQKEGFEHPSEEAYGKGWKAIRDEFTKGILRLIATGKGVTFISHATEREIKMRGGEKYDRISPTMSGQARDILEGLVDLWFYYGYDGGDRTLTIQGSDHIGAGHRLKNNFKYTDGTPITEIPMGANAEQAYANLLAAFHNKLENPTANQPPAKTSVKKKLTLKRKK